MPSLNKNKTPKKPQPYTKKDTMSMGEQLYTMQIALKPTFASAFSTLSSITSRGVTGFDIFGVMKKGLKYSIIYDKKVTEKEAKEIFDKIKDFAELEMSLIE